MSTIVNIYLSPFIMKLNDLIQHYGSAYLARVAVGVSYSCFSMWKKRGFIPMLAQMRIEKLTRGKLIADDDDARIPSSIPQDN